MNNDSNNKKIYIYSAIILVTIIVMAATLFWNAKKGLGVKKTKNYMSPKVLASVFSNYKKLASPDDVDGDYKKMSPVLIEKLEWLKHTLGKKIKVQRGYIAPNLDSTLKVENNELAHSYGVAIDCETTGIDESMEIAIQAYKNGFRRIGIGWNVVHLDIANKPDLIWSLDKKVNEEFINIEIRGKTHEV